MFETIHNSFFSDFSHSFYYLSLLISAVVGLICLRQCKDGFRVIIILIEFVLVSELIAKYVVTSTAYSNNIVYHIYTPVEFLLYAIIYSYFLHSKKWKLILGGCVIFMIVAEVANTYLFQALDQTNTNTIMLESILLVFLSLVLFLRISETANFQNILKSGVFWFNSAILIYYSFNILVWGFHSIKVYQLKNPPIIIYNMLLVFSGLLYLTFTGSIILHKYFNNKNLHNNE